MMSNLTAQLTNLLERWEMLADAAAQRIDTTNAPVQGSFYAGVLFGIGLSCDELAEALARELVESAKSSTGTLSSAEQSSN
jgi:hypothetical protein